MADTKITALTALTAADPASDVLPIVDISDTTMAASGTTKKISVNNILGAGGTATLASATITGDLTVATDRLKVVTGSTAVQIGATTQTQIGTTAWPSTDIGKSNARFLVGNEGIVINWNESSPVIGNYSSIFAGAKTGIGATTIGGLQIRAGIENASNRDGFCSFWTSNQAAGGYVKRYEIDSNGVSTWSVGGSTAMTLNANGLGIGVTPSAQLASYKSFQFGIGGNLIGRSDDSGIELSSNSYRNSGGNYIYLNTTTAASYRQYSGTHQWFTAPSGTAGNAITFTQAMTLDASGNLLVGTTGTVVSSDSRFRVSATAVPAVDAKTTAATQAVVDEWNSDTSGDNLFNRFWTESSPIAFRGSISYNRAGGLVAYNTTSDYRAKDIIGPVSNSGSLIDSLKVYVGKMKGATIERPMLIAHELQEVAPYAVSGEKDAVDADGKPKYQQMDASALVPLLIAEIKSLRARVQTLEAK
jgi:hypothetical protein